MLRPALRCTSVLALFAATVVSGCSSKDKASDSARVADSMSAATPATTPTPAAPAAPTMTDANIVAVLDAANVADSSSGSVASSKGTNAEVKTFGKDMMRDHHALRKAGADLAKKLSVTPEMPAGDSTQASASAWMDTLNATPKGAEFDKKYIDHEVAAHTQVLATAQSALSAAQNQELKDLITKAAPNIQAHLDHAKMIQGKLGTP